MATSGPPSPDLLELLCKRADVLARLGDDVSDKRTLEEQLGCSRSTLNRAIRELEARGLVASSPGTVEVTLAGDVALSIFEDVWEPLADAVPVIRHLPDDAPFDPALLDGAGVVEASLSAPDEPLDELATAVDDATSVSATVPTSSSQYVRTFADDGDALETAEFVFAEECFEALVSDRDRQLCPADDSSVWVTQRRPPYSLVVIDGRRLWLGIHDRQGQIAGAILNDGDAAVDWATETFRSLRRRATSPVTG